MHSMTGGGHKKNYVGLDAAKDVLVVLIYTLYVDAFCDGFCFKIICYWLLECERSLGSTYIHLSSDAFCERLWSNKKIFWLRCCKRSLGSTYIPP